MKCRVMHTFLPSFRGNVPNGIWVVVERARKEITKLRDMAIWHPQITRPKKYLSRAGPPGVQIEFNKRK
jgi:hypothetical protein